MPLKSGFKSFNIFLYAPEIDISSNLVPRFSATTFASFSEVFDVNSDGNITHLTFSDPKASAAIVATNAESIPPDIPRTTFSKPLFFV